MKVSLLGLAIAVCAVSAVPDYQILLKNLRNNAVSYVLFTRNNLWNGQDVSDVTSINNSHFNPNHPTVVVVHGWLGSQENGMTSAVTEAFLNREQANVIVFDWSHRATSTYSLASQAVPALGMELGQYLSFLVDATGISFDTIHLVGFCLGGHLVGIAGRTVNGRVARITALSPAGPMWFVNPDRISADDAQYVEGIHTDGGLSNSLGMGIPIADADFFPNGGNSQPGCLTSICHHNRAWRVFAATITYNHLVGRQCTGMVQVNLNICRGASLNMGNSDLRKNGSGLYRVNTDWRYPF